jgi:hypothetical protein
MSNLPVKIPYYKNKASLNEAYREFCTAKYWAATKGATFEKIFPNEVKAYNAYVKGDVEAIQKQTAELVKQYGKPLFKAGERMKARATFYGTHPSRLKKKIVPRKVK